MSNYDQLDSIIQENNGYLYTSEAKDKGISSTIISKYIKDNNLSKVARSLYREEDSWIDELYEIRKVNQKAILSHESALYLHNLIDKEPFQNAVTVYAGYNATHIRERGVKVYQVDSEVYEMGCTTAVTLFGHEVKCYDIERTLCDIVKNKSNMDIGIYTAAWKSFFQKNNKDIQKLMKYAKKLKVEKQIRGYLELGFM